MEMVPALVIFIFGLIGACASESPVGEKQNTWALLVASAGAEYDWANYGLQADVCHAYHTLRATGIPADRIIVMMPDDAVNDPRNPHKGKLINRFNGTDVYAGVKIDYRGEDVNVENFLNVLSGNKEAMSGKGTGRVIESDESAELIVFLNDHGGPQLVYFDVGKALYASQLHATIATMHSQKKYNKMFFFLGTCFSGSMFDGLYPAELNVYAMTSSNSSQESEFCDCDVQLDMVCLSDRFSAAWLGLLDSQPKGTPVSFDQIFKAAKEKVEPVSEVSHYGNLELGSSVIIANEVGATPVPMDSRCFNSRQKIPVFLGNEDHFRWLVANAKDDESRKTAKLNLERYIEKEYHIVELEMRLLSDLSICVPEIHYYDGVVLPSNPKSRECYQDLVEHFNEHCAHPLRFSKILAMFVNACVIEEDLSGLKTEITNTCEPFKDLLKSSTL